MSRKQGPKQIPFEKLALVARTLGRAARLEILDYLAQGARSVDELAQAAGLSVAENSKHLRQLKARGLVEASRDGKHIRYRLADDRVLDAIRDLPLLAISAISRWYARDVTPPRYSEDPEQTLSDLQIVLTEERPAGDDERGPHIVAARLMFLVPRNGGELLEDCRRRLRATMAKRCP